VLEAVARSFQFLAYSSHKGTKHWRIREREAILGQGIRKPAMDKTSENVAPQPDRFHELRTRLAAGIASIIHSQENLTTGIPGLQMFRRTARSQLPAATGTLR
jgi:hypothetical protein